MVFETQAKVRVPTAQDVWEALDPSTLSPLISADAFDRIRFLSARFQLPMRMACLECRLDAHEDKADFSVCLLNGNIGNRWKEPMAVPDGAAWNRSINLLDVWSSGKLPPAIPFIWYAFDMDGRSSSLPLPCISVCVDPVFFARRLGGVRYPGASPLSPQELRRMMELCHQQLHEVPLAPETGEWLEACVSALEGVGHANHFSFMLSRSPATVKFDVRLRKAAAVPFLRKIGWQGAVAGLQEGIEGFMPWDGQIQLNLVLGPRKSRPLEAEFLTMPGEAGKTERTVFLKRMVSAGLCSPGKADVLAEIDRRLRVDAVGKDRGFSIHRGWYAKILFQEDCPVEAKAYVGFKPGDFSGQ
jgi:hypothetical protein